MAKITTFKDCDSDFSVWGFDLYVTAESLNSS